MENAVLKRAIVAQLEISERMVDDLRRQNGHRKTDHAMLSSICANRAAAQCSRVREFLDGIDAPGEEELRLSNSLQRMWLIGMHLGQALALAKAVRSPRPGSRTAALADLARLHPHLTAGQLNLRLPKPLHIREAHKVVAYARQTLADEGNS